MKRAITVGLIVAGMGTVFLLIWQNQQEQRVIQEQVSAGFMPRGFDSTAVVKIQPFMPPVIEFQAEQQQVEKEKEEEGDLVGEADDLYDPETLGTLLQAEKKADAQALQVLQTGREMALEGKEIIQGGCWDYVNAVYNRAGCTEEKREVVFQKGEGEQYAAQEMIRPGDWLFYINHSYKEVRHSAIFVDWLDYEQQTGLMLSYSGEGRGEPARYRAYDLRHVYYIIRPLER